MERSSFFNAVLDQSGTPDRAYLAEDFAKYFSSFIGNGVFPNPANQLQVVAVDNNMQIRLKQGMAWINGYFYVNTDALILKLEPADGVLSRIDRIILRLDFLNREIKAKVKKGSFASSPVAPVLQRDADAYEIAIADVYVRAGVISIMQSNITDTRLNSNVCGIVHGTISQVDTTEIFRQYQAWFLENKTLHENDFEIWMSEFKTVVGKKFTDWVEDIKNSLDPNEDIAAQLQMQISANKSSLDDKVSKLDFDKLGEFKNICTLLNAKFDLNTLDKNGNYMGVDLVNAPSSEWFYIKNLKHATTHSYQKAIPVAPTFINSKATYERWKEGGVWTPWFSLFQSVSSMKAKIASATTDMGVPTDATATGDTMAGNIRKIFTGKKFAKGLFNKPYQINGLDFKPNLIAFYVKNFKPGYISDYALYISSELAYLVNRDSINVYFDSSPFFGKITVLDDGFKVVDARTDSECGWVAIG